VLKKFASNSTGEAKPKIGVSMSEDNKNKEQTNTSLDLITKEEAAAIAQWKKKGWSQPDVHPVFKKSPALLLGVSLLVVFVVALIAFPLVFLQKTSEENDIAYTTLEEIALAYRESRPANLTTEQELVAKTAQRSELANGSYALFAYYNQRCWAVIVGREDTTPYLAPGRCS